MKNKRHIISMVLIIVVGLLCLGGCASAPDTKPSEKPAVDPSLLDPSASVGQPNNPYADLDPEEFMAAMGLTPGMQSTSVNALYNWYGRSFSELEEEATQIVIARGTNFYKKSEITQTAELQVLKTFKGTEHSSIVLYQFEGEVDIQVGETYILFMKSQGNDVPNGYYALAGNQGVMYINGSAKQVVVYDQNIQDDDLTAWIAKNIAGDRELSSFYSETQAYTTEFIRK